MDGWIARLLHFSSSLLLLLRLYHILVMGRTINGHTLMSKAATPLFPCLPLHPRLLLLSVDPDGSLFGDALIKIAPLHLLALLPSSTGK